MSPEERRVWIDSSCDAGYRAGLTGANVMLNVGWPLWIVATITLGLMAVTAAVLWREP